MALCHTMLMQLILFLISLHIAATRVAANGNRSSISLLSPGLFSPSLATILSTKPDALALSTSDFGLLTFPLPPEAVLRPRLPADIASLIRTSFRLLTATQIGGGQATPPFTVAARGHGHSLWAQASAPGGVVVDMSALDVASQRTRVSVAEGYVDVGGEQLWIDVLQESLKHGVAPKSWTDYLQITVGGTLSNAGVSGQTFRHGPQISNVFELDVVTGKGEMLTCSPKQHPDLFNAVLGGLGQFGVITRARIALERAPQRARWLRLFYSDFARFTTDQESLTKAGGDAASWESGDGFDYVEGWVNLGPSSINGSASTFFSNAELARIAALAAAAPQGIIYTIEACLYYSNSSSDPATIDRNVSSLLKGLGYAPGFAFSKDVTYETFLNRVSEEEAALRAIGGWNVPHPWLMLFVPKSSVAAFDEKVFRGVLATAEERGEPAFVGPLLMYPLQRSKWDGDMSVVVPDEAVFYKISLLKSAVRNDTAQHLAQNAEILRVCDSAGIQYKEYLPHYTTVGDWKKHFGDKWNTFYERKMKYDPLAILAPGQGIFTSGS